MRKVISFCLWGNDPKYCVGAVRNAELAKTVYPGWICRYYLGTSVSQETIAELSRHDNVETFIINEPGDWRSMFWRFVPAYDETVDVMISRDTDSRLSLREKAAVDEWLVSGKGFHLMRDHPFHDSTVLGGMWGLKKGTVPAFEELLKRRSKENSYDTDQAFLREDIYPIVMQEDNVIIHAEFWKYESIVAPFPTPRIDLEFIGEVFNENNESVLLHTQALQASLLEQFRI
jgi:protein O-GlcNAc transferase